MVIGVEETSVKALLTTRDFAVDEIENKKRKETEWKKEQFSFSFLFVSLFQVGIQFLF